MLNDEIFFEHQTITQEDFFIQLEQGASVKTSQPAPYALLEAWERLLEKHEQVIYIPMSSGLSGSYETAAVMAQEYEGRVYPVNNHRISVTLRQSVLEWEEKIRAVAENQGDRNRWISHFLQFAEMETIDRRVVVQLIQYIKVISKTEIHIEFRYKDEYRKAMAFAEQMMRREAV